MKKLWKALAQISRNAAKRANGTASEIGIYQPKRVKK